MYRLQLTESCCPAQTDQDLRDNTVGDVLRIAAATHGDSPCLWEVNGEGEIGRRWSFAEQLADSERLARALLTRYRPGERIAVWAPNVPEWVLAEFALGLAGLVLVTVNPGYQPRELKYVLEQSRAVGLFLIAEFRGNPMAKIAAEVTADIPAIREVIDLEDHAALFREAGPLAELPHVAPLDPVQIQYTSGTTGFPKGVVLHHHGITNNARHFMAMMKAQAGETMLAIMPLFHTAGCGMTILGAVQQGCRLLLMRQFDGATATRLIEEQRVNLVMCVPTMLILMLEADVICPRDYPSVRLAAAGVAEVAVVGVPDERMGEAVAAFVRMGGGAIFDSAALIVHCRSNVAAQKTPTHWIEVSEWPLTGSGKIQKFMLRDRWVAGEFAPVDRTQALT